MSFLKKLFGSMGQSQSPQPSTLASFPRAKIGKCDICSGEIKEGEGYAFYSEASIPFLGVLGSMHVCESCTNHIITEERFAQATHKINVMSRQEAADPKKVRETITETNATSIALLCKRHSFSPQQAKEKARELSLRFWQHGDPARAAAETAEFWKSGNK